MPRYIEKETDLEVDVTCIAAYRGEPIGAIVTMPNGTRWSLPMDRVPLYFDLVTPQHVELATMVPGFNRIETLADVYKRKAAGLEVAHEQERAEAARLRAELSELRAKLAGG